MCPSSKDTIEDGPTLFCDSCQAIGEKSEMFIEEVWFKIKAEKFPDPKVESDVSMVEEPEVKEDAVSISKPEK